MLNINKKTNKSVGAIKMENGIPNINRYTEAATRCVL